MVCQAFRGHERNMEDLHRGAKIQQIKDESEKKNRKSEQ